MTAIAESERAAQIRERLEKAGDDYVVLTGFSLGMAEHFAHSRADIAFLLSENARLQASEKVVKAAVKFKTLVEHRYFQAEKIGDARQALFYEIDLYRAEKPDV